MFIQWYDAGPYSDYKSTIHHFLERIRADFKATSSKERMEGTLISGHVSLIHFRTWWKGRCQPICTFDPRSFSKKSIPHSMHVRQFQNVTHPTVCLELIMSDAFQE
jgi:hypothetical protein